MTDERATNMILELIPESVLAEIVELKTDSGVAYIAQFNKSLCLGAPLVVINNSGEYRYARKEEAESVVERAKIEDLLNPDFYV